MEWHSPDSAVTSALTARPLPTHVFRDAPQKSEHPEVFGFRIIAATVGSFSLTDKVKNSNSLAFVDGIPIFERFFLGDEFTIRGYNVRSITPVAPLDTFVTSKNVVIASNAAGTPIPVAGLPAGLANIGVFTGPSGSNSVSLPRSFTSIGGDTQLLGNFEYRIPIISDKVSTALFTDIGSAFNLRGSSDQLFSSNFLTDQPFLGTVGVINCPRAPAGAAFVSLTTLAACNGSSQLALTGSNGLVWDQAHYHGSAYECSQPRTGRSINGFALWFSASLPAW